MLLTDRIPKELVQYKAGITAVELADQRDGELLLILEENSKRTPNMQKLLDVLLKADGVQIDGNPLRIDTFGNLRGNQEETLIYLDWSGKGNASQVSDELDVEHWDLVSDGKHNSNSFMIYWKDNFWMIHASSPYHFATPECKLVLYKSSDAIAWKQVATFNVPDEDIRDPKFAIIGDRLFIYVLKSLVEDGSEPYTTAYTYSEDGENWTPLTELLNNFGWLFWDPKTIDNKTWYVPAYWGGHGNSVMLKTEDGIDFKVVCYIHRGKIGLLNDRNDETDFGFLADETMISTQRLEFSEDMNGDKRACTHLAICKPPYTEWESLGWDYTTRLDGPSLFSYNGNVYAVGRHNPYEPVGPNYIGSVFGRKRTSLYQVTMEGLIYLSDLPSAGDTAYGGCVLKDGFLYACYYTSPLDVDWPWIFGMLSQSDIRMVKIPLNQIEALAAKRKDEYTKNNSFKLVKE